MIMESGENCNSFYSNHCNVKSVEYLKLLFLSLGSPLAALERGIFNVTKGPLMGEKIQPKSTVTSRPSSKYVS